ncbi:MAG TPA: DNA polymerase III subunit gamma and tau, partial [Cellulomonas sp.]
APVVPEPVVSAAVVPEPVVPAPVAAAPAPAELVVRAPEAPAAVPAPGPARAAQPPSAPAPSTPPPAAVAAMPPSGPAAPAVRTPQPAPAPAPAAPATSSGPDTEMLRRRWPEVLETLGRLKKATWVLVSQNALVADLDATTLRLSFTAPGLATAFRGGAHADVVKQAVRETLGFDVRVESVLAEPGAGAPAPADGSGDHDADPAHSSSSPRGRGRGTGDTTVRSGRPGGAGSITPAQAAASWDSPGVTAAVPTAFVPTPPANAPDDTVPSATSPDAAPDDAIAVDPAVDPAADAHPASDEDPGAPEPYDDDPGEPAHYPAPEGHDHAVVGHPVSAREAAERAYAAGRESAHQAQVEDDPSPDDPDLMSTSLTGAPLVAQLLGGTVIDEQLDDPTR